MHSKFTKAQNDLLLKDDQIANEKKLLLNAESQLSSVKSELEQKHKLTKSLDQENQKLVSLRERNGLLRRCSF